MVVRIVGTPYAFAVLARDRKSTRLNSSHTVIYTLSLHDALPILIRKDRLDLLEDLTAAFRGDGGENRRDSVRLCGLGESGDVVDHQRRVVAVDVGQLRWLVIDQENGAILWRQKRVETNLRERRHHLCPSFETVGEKQADRIQRLCGRFDRSDDCDKSVWHPHPHVKPGIDTVGRSTFDVSS